jgi:hypothetical protein
LIIHERAEAEAEAEAEVGVGVGARTKPSDCVIVKTVFTEESTEKESSSDQMLTKHLNSGRVKGKETLTVSLKGSLRSMLI